MMAQNVGSVLVLYLLPGSRDGYWLVRHRDVVFHTTLEMRIVTPANRKAVFPQYILPSKDFVFNNYWILCIYPCREEHG